MNKESISEESNSNVRTWHLINEGRWLIQFVFTVFLAVSLITYDVNDPCWTVASSTENIHNHGGWLGAIIADYCYFFWGFSSIWFLIAMLRSTIFSFLQLIYCTTPSLFLKNLDCLDSDGRKQPFILSIIMRFRKDSLFLNRLIAFFFLIFSSAMLESLRFWSFFYKKYDVPGGIFGDFLGQILSTLIGFTGGTLLLIALIFISLSIWWSFSWIDLAEFLGGRVIQIGFYLRQKIFSIKDKNFEKNEVGKEIKSSELLDRGLEEKNINEFDKLKEDVSEKIKITSSENVTKDSLIISQITENLNSFVSPPFNTDSDGDFCKQKTEISKETYQQVMSPPVFIAAKTVESLPSLDLLDKPPITQERISDETLSFTKKLIEKKLKDFGVSVKVHDAFTGPIVTRYEIEPDIGIKGSQIVNLAKDLARSFSLVSIRVVETIPGKNLMALELPNSRRQIVKLSEILGAEVYQRATSPLTICLGKDIAGLPICADLAKMPHLLVAGTTGSGKSVGINAMILSLLYKASAHQVRMILIDPKMLELSVYEGIPHLLCPVVTDMSQAIHALNWAISEMERRYKLMSKLGVRNLDGYNVKVSDSIAVGQPIIDPFSVNQELECVLDMLPAIVIVIDELADLIMVMGKKIEELIARIAQKARAAGIHLILATQRPSVDVITGLIKANIPTRIAFQVSSKVDSRTILDQQGADTLLGMGDMLYLPPGSGTPLRVHGAFVSDEEVARVVKNLQSFGKPNYIDGILNGSALINNSDMGSNSSFVNDDVDPLYDQAVEIVLKHRRASISLVQRHLRIGYNRAARILEQMEAAELVSPMGISGNREILVPFSEKN